MSEMITCPGCKGTKWQSIDARQARLYGLPSKVECPQCDFTGQVRANKGETPEETTIGDDPTRYAAGGYGTTKGTTPDKPTDSSKANFYHVVPGSERCLNGHPMVRRADVTQVFLCAEPSCQYFDPTQPQAEGQTFEDVIENIIGWLWYAGKDLPPNTPDTAKSRILAAHETDKQEAVVAALEQLKSQCRKNNRDGWVPEYAIDTLIAEHRERGKK